MSVDLDKIAEGVINSIKGFVAQAVGSLSQRIDQLDSAVKEWKQLDPSAIAKEAAALIPPPKDGAPGKDVEIDVIRALIASEVASIPRPENGRDADPATVIEAAKAAVQAMPKPLDGKSVSIDDVVPLLEKLVADAVKTIPAPENGKDADPEVIRQMLAKAVSEIPKAIDGTSITTEDVAPLIAAEVKRAVSDIPAAPAGKSVDPEEVARMVADAVAGIPKAQDGKDADPAYIAELVAQEVSKIPPAKDGKDADIVVMRQMVSDAIKELPTPQDGKSVPIEEVRRMVDEAVSKAIAAIVVKDGAPGRDALSLEIMPTIDVEKSYSRNQYATYGGGLWRSFETTHGMKGWECIVDGIASIEVQEPKERVCRVVVRRSSGAEESKEFTVPGVIDKGIFQPSESYTRGDMVTFGGSLFLAQKDMPSGKPCDSNDWRLASKRGRDGKDFRPEEEKKTQPVRLK